MPEKVRERLRVKKTVRARITDNKRITEPSGDPLEELADQVDFTFTSILEELPTLRRPVGKQYEFLNWLTMSDFF